MPRLSNVTLKAMALTGNPANRRPIHAMKSASTQEEPMPKGPAADHLDEALQEPSAEVLKALSEVKLNKSADEDSVAAAEAVGRLLAVHKGLTLDDVLAVAKAAGLEPVAKAKGDDMEDEDMDPNDADDAQDKNGKFKKGNPFAKKMADAKKSVSLEDVIKSGASVEVAKAVESLRKSYEVELAKTNKMLHEERDHRLTGLIKSEMVSTFKNLGVDHDKLTSIVKSARSAGKADQAADLLQILKAADAQLGLAAKSGGSAFSNVGKSTQFGAAQGGTDAMARINAHVDSIVQKGEVSKSRPQLVDEFLMTKQGMELWAQHNEEKGA